MEYVGEVMVSLLGLDESRYQYVIDGMTEEDWEIARQVRDKRLREREMQQERREMGEMEDGGGAADRNDSGNSGNSGLA